MSLNLKASLRAPFWKRLGEPSNTLPGPQDSAWDNNYVRYVFSTSGSAIPALNPMNSTNQFEITAGHTVVDGALGLSAISVPATPTIANVGTAGVTTYTYTVVAMAGNLAAPSATATTTTGNATLTTSNYNTITFKPVTGANSYIIYRTVGGSTQGIIAVVVGGYLTNSPTAETIVISDQALVADGSTAPTTNITGAVIGDWDVYGNINVNALTTPATPVATVNGTAGSTTNAYKVVARCGSAVSPTGHTAASTAVSVTTCAATLTSTNSVTLKWQPVAGAVGYDVYRTSSGGTPSSTGKINTSLVLTAQGGFTDTGLAGDSSSAPTTNTTGILNGSTSGDTAELAQINDTNGNPEITFTATTSAVNGITIANAATGNAPSITAGGTSGADANVGLTIAPKGTGAIVIGSATGTGSIGLGTSSGAQEVDIANGSGAPTVTVANTSTAGATVTVASAATATGNTDTVNIGAGNTAGTGAKTINIASGAPAGTGTDTVNIGTGNAASTAYKKVNIATGTPNTSGHNWVTIGGGTTTSATLNAVVVSYQAMNIGTSVSGNGTTTLTFNLVDAAGNNVTLAAGLQVVLKLTTALSAGAITVTMNGGTGKSLKSHFNVSNNIATAYASTGVVTMYYDGTEWCDLSQ